jgi:biopolymer transport protein ExbD
VLEADERVSHGRVVEAMDAARRAGASGLVVGTRPREDAAPAP